MTEKEKFYKAVDERLEEYKKMSTSNYMFLKWDIEEKYRELYPNSIVGVGLRDLNEDIARMEIALKMGKPVDEITGEKYDPNLIY